VHAVSERLDIEEKERLEVVKGREVWRADDSEGQGAPKWWGGGREWVISKEQLRPGEGRNLIGHERIGHPASDGADLYSVFALVERGWAILPARVQRQALTRSLSGWDAYAGPKRSARMWTLPDLAGPCDRAVHSGASTQHP
jgi:hypothetical protein